MTTELLGFDSMDYNGLCTNGQRKDGAQRGFRHGYRGRNFGKMAFDACMFNCQNFGFVKWSRSVNG